MSTVNTFMPRIQLPHISAPDSTQYIAWCVCDFRRSACSQTAETSQDCSTDYELSNGTKHAWVPQSLWFIFSISLTTSPFSLFASRSPCSLSLLDFLHVLAFGNELLGEIPYFLYKKLRASIFSTTLRPERLLETERQIETERLYFQPGFQYKSGQGSQQNLRFCHPTPLKNGKNDNQKVLFTKQKLGKWSEKQSREHATARLARTLHSTMVTVRFY